MKAAQIRSYGGPEAVEINRSAVKPSPQPGQLLVEVCFAAVNPVDWKIREGYLQHMMPLKFPATLGMDFSGVVAASGEGVAGFRKGEEVYGQTTPLRGGSFAEFTVADAKNVSGKPQRSSHAEAASLVLAGVSAWQALIDHMSLAKGQKILIHGGAGGIGQVAIQIAKHIGARVAATVSARDLDYVQGLGADEALDYKALPFDEVFSNCDAVFDTVGGETYARSYKVLKRGGIIVSMLEGPHAEMMERYGVRAIGQFTKVTNERLGKLAVLVEEGVIKAHIDRVFPLDKAREALDYQQNGHPRGKVVLEVKKG